jgi:ferredoxin
MSPNNKTARIVFVNQKDCTGCESCVAMTPDVFRMTSDGLAEVHNPQGDSEEKIQEAMDGCPASCINWKP